MANPQNLIPFKKGQSGNPSGRPAEAKQFREMCRKFLFQEGGWSKFMELLESKDEKIRLQTLQYLTDHGIGKATQPQAGADDEFTQAVPGVIVVTSDSITEVKSA